MNEPKQPRRLNTSAANHSGSAPRPAAPAGQRKINPHQHHCFQSV